MATKDKLLALLQSCGDQYVSGEEIASQLSLSRTAIWKAVNALRASGYAIDAVQNKGYRLKTDADALSEENVRKYLLPEYPLSIRCLTVVPSTNAVLRDEAASGTQEGTVVIAGEQTNGRGRLGHSFYSPADTGLYMSVLLRPVGITPVQAVRITTMAAVAVCEAIQALSGRETQIKWVNDIFMDGRKICGILTEGSFNLETGSLDSVILGVGMNVCIPRAGFPAEIAETAGAIFTETQRDARCRLAAEFLNRFMKIYKGKNSVDYAETYRKKSMVIGREIEVLTQPESRRATALDVDRDCRLVVRYEDGTVEALSSAEIRIRVPANR